MKNDDTITKKNERRKRKLPSGWKAFVFVIVFVYKKG